MKTMQIWLAGVVGVMLVSAMGGCAGQPLDSARKPNAPEAVEPTVQSTVSALILAINAHDRDQIAELLDARFVEHNPMPKFGADKAGALAMFKEHFTAFPDVHCQPDVLLAEGDLVAMKLTTTGTNTGPFMGQPATNRSVKVDEIHILRVREGKILEHWGLADERTMMAQLGLTKEDSMRQTQAAPKDSRTNAPMN